MSSSLREMLNRPSGKAVAGIVVSLGAALLVWSLKDSIGSSAAGSSRDRMFVDSTTGKPFGHEVSAGESYPVVAPTGGHTGFPAELCYWTKDGKTATDPTYVLLNLYVHKPGPTFCPVCGRLVVPHNPSPQPGASPPPTQAEYAARGNGN